MGRPLPGYAVALLDADGHARPTRARSRSRSIRAPARADGRLRGRPGADAPRPCPAAYYRTGDEATARRTDGYLTYVGRGDDVFKSSDYRISPFELESVLIEHPAVAEAAVVPSPDPLRLAVPKAFVVLAPGSPDASWRATPRVHPRDAGAVQAHPPAGVLRAAQDHLGQDPPRRAARQGGRAPCAGHARRARVLRGRLPRAGAERALRASAPEHRAGSQSAICGHAITSAEPAIISST